MSTPPDLPSTLPPGEPRPETPRKVGYKERIRRMVEEYGPVAFVLYFVLFFATWGGSALAIRYFGWHPQSAAGTAGLWTAAYIGTKVTQPIRLAVWIGLTPVAARLFGRKPRPTVAPPLPGQERGAEQE